MFRKEDKDSQDQRSKDANEPAKGKEKKLYIRRKYYYYHQNTQLLCCHPIIHFSLLLLVLVKLSLLILFAFSFGISTLLLFLWLSLSKVIALPTIAIGSNTEKKP